MTDFETPTLVSDPDDVTPAWLTAVLRHSGAIGAGDEVTGFETQTIGTGQVGANIRYRLHYASEGGAGPASVVGKFASRDELSRATGIQTLTYETEVAFYRDIADTVEISRPACHFAEVVPGTADVALVLEDLAPAEQGDQIDGCTVEQAEVAVVEAARLHGPRWGDPTLLEHAWLADRAAGTPGIAQFYDMLWAGFVDRYTDVLDDATVRVGERFRSTIGGWAERPPVALTVCHNDYRLDNMLFASEAGGRELAVVDWQTVRLGLGTADVAYFLSASFADVDVRRAHERDLVARYHEELLRYDVPGYSFDACWDDYRRTGYSGLLMAVIASMIVGRTDRGDAMFMAMANRAAAQIVDLDAEALVT